MAVPADVAPEPGKRLAIICWSSDLDKVWPVLILATTAAASGMTVDVFYTFWGIRVLQRNDRRITGRGIAQRGLSMIDRGGTRHLRLGRLSLGGVGTRVARLLAREHKVASPTELMGLALALGVRMYPCQTSMDMYGLTREDLIDGIGPTMGAASFLETGVAADVTLFI